MAHHEISVGIGCILVAATFLVKGNSAAPGSFSAIKDRLQAAPGISDSFEMNGVRAGRAGVTWEVVPVPKNRPPNDPLGKLQKLPARPFESVEISQLLRRKSGSPGDPTSIRVWGAFREEPISAEWAARWAASTQEKPVGIPSIPEGTISGMPLGESCWHSVQKGSARIVAYDTFFYVQVDVMGQPAGRSEGSYNFLDIAQADLEVAEYCARMWLSAFHRAYHDFDAVRPSAATLAGARVATKRTSAGQTFAKAGDLVSAKKGSVEQKAGVFTLNIGGKSVVAPVGARELIFGSRRVKLPAPVLYDGKDLWIERSGLAKALGI